MGPRNMLILFFSTLCVSLVLLIILFSFGFKDIDLEFNTKVPESAPDLGKLYKEVGEPTDSRAETVTSATIRVPQSGRPLESLNGVSPTEDIAPELEAEQQQEPEVDNAAPPVPAGDEGVKVVDKKDEPKDAKKDDKTEPKKDVKKTGPQNPATVSATGEVKPAKELKPLVPQPKPEEAAKSATSSYQVYIDGFATREEAQAKADQVGGFVRSAGSGFMVQVGVFSSKENADSVAAKSGARVRKQ